jgi:CMD domain protein
LISAHRVNLFCHPYARGGADGQAVVCPLLRGRSPTRGVAPKSHPLSVEDKAGLIYLVSVEGRQAIGERLAAALEHVHLLVFRPRDANPAAMQALLDAGWSSTGIVTLSQLVAFLSFQVRSVAGLRALGAPSGKSAGIAAKVSQGHDQS